ncbi:MAG TPA: hypothetical protein VFH61_05800, partial [Thermoleophilia bacterium]|nr:hypothetical protein [Thermoleophilia bacterium]
LPLEDTIAFATIPLPPGFPRRPRPGRYAEWLEKLAEGVRRAGLEPPAKPTGPVYEYLHFLAPDEWTNEVHWLTGGEPHEPPDCMSRVQRVRVSPGDQLWDLHLLSEQLSMRYGWSPTDATVFVLTGIIPAITKALAHVHDRSPFAALTRIVLEIDPRMSALDVKKLYSKARTWVRRGGDRAMSEKHLQLAIFLATNGSQVPHWIGMEAESRTWLDMEGESRPRRDAGHASETKLGALAPDSAEPTLKWPQLQRRWNDLWRKSQPDWCGYSDVQARQFSRDAQDAWKRVTGQEWWTPKTVEEHKARKEKKPRRKPAS